MLSSGDERTRRPHHTTPINSSSNNNSKQQRERAVAAMSQRANHPSQHGWMSSVLATIYYTTTRGSSGRRATTRCGLNLLLKIEPCTCAMVDAAAALCTTCAVGGCRGLGAAIPSSTITETQQRRTHTLLGNGMHLRVSFRIAYARVCIATASYSSYDAILIPVRDVIAV